MYHFEVSFEFPLGYDGREKHILKGSCAFRLVRRWRDKNPARGPLHSVLSDILPGSGESEGVVLVWIGLFCIFG